MNIKSILRAARSVKIAVLVDRHSMSVEKGQGVKRLMRAIMQITGDSAKVIRSNCALFDSVPDRLSRSTSVPFCLGSLELVPAMRMATKCNWMMLGVNSFEA